MNKIKSNYYITIFVGILLVSVLFVGINKVYAAIDEAYYLENYSTPKLVDGWNLISPLLISDFYKTKNSSASSEGNSMWFFNPGNKEYISHSDTVKNNSDAKDRFLEWSNKVNIQDAYLVSVPAWFYKSDRSNVTLDSDLYIGELIEIFHANDSSQFKFHSYDRPLEHIYKGWNLLTTNPITLNYPLEDYIGNCDINSMYYFNPFKQNWDKLKINSDGILKNNGRDLPLGSGIAINVSRDCKFDYSSIRSGEQYPSIPDLPNN